MGLDPDEWTAVMAHGLRVLFPPLYRDVERGATASAAAARSIQKMEEAAAEVREVAKELRTDEYQAMAEELAGVAEEIASAL